MQTEETAVEAHAMGRHVSEHPEDKAFWAKTCEVCAITSRLQPFMVTWCAAWASKLTDEQLETYAALPIDGMTPGEMLEKIMAGRELEKRRG